MLWQCVWRPYSCVLTLTAVPIGPRFRMTGFVLTPSNAAKARVACNVNKSQGCLEQRTGCEVQIRRKLASDTDQIISDWSDGSDYVITHCTSTRRWQGIHVIICIFNMYFFIVRYGSLVDVRRDTCYKIDVWYIIWTTSRTTTRTFHFIIDRDN